MSLRGRVIGLVALVLLLSVSIYTAIAWSEARRDLAAELGSARLGAIQTARSTFDTLGRSDHVRRDMRQLVATFDGNRHLTAALLTRGGEMLARSRAALPRYAAPEWFARSLAPDRERTLLVIPGGGGDMLRLEPEPASDIAALWAASSSAVSVFAVAAAVTLALIHWVISRAFTPLEDLSRGLRAVGGHGALKRVREDGPPELLALQRGFNDMAQRLAAIDARNQALEAQLLTIQDEERADIARDLHDEIGPHLFAVSLDAEMIGRSISDGNLQAVPEQLRSIQSAVSFMQREVRDLIARLRPTRAAELGLEAALADLVSFWQSRQPEVSFDTALEDVDHFVPERLRDVIYRTVQEAVANALRHAETTSVAVAVTRVAGGAAIRVANRGKARPVAQEGPGLGLISMRERIHNAGGTLQVERAQSGWTILARFEQGLAERNA